MPNDLEGWKQFMAEQQAEFWADLRAIEGKHAEIAAQQAQTTRLADENRQRISQLVDVCLSLAGHGEETDRRIRDLTESQAHTDRRLDVLIDVVEKLVKHNGSHS
ncbi:MAG: hypothetical protein ACRD2O_02900 [Terriglobia bacterium]